jgi:uncharacterized membrane protein YhaH (DUF805 family)
MNKPQKSVVAAGVALVALSALFPPYYAEYVQQGHYRKKYLGYRLVFSPPSDTEVYKFLWGDLPVADIGWTEQKVIESGKTSGESEASIQKAIQYYREDQEKADRKMAEPLLQRTNCTLDTDRVWLQIGLIAVLAIGGVVLLADQGSSRRMTVEEPLAPDDVTAITVANPSRDLTPLPNFPHRESTVNRSGFQYWNYVFTGLRGRIPVRTFGLASLAWTIACVLVINGSLCESAFLNYLSWPMIPVLMYTGIALTIKRLHDGNSSGWWLLFGLVPFVGPVVIPIVCYFMRGTVGPNDYGEDPVP